MARSPDLEIVRLKKEVPLERLVPGFGVELKRHGAELFGRLPFHEDKMPSLVVSPNTNLCTVREVKRGRLGQLLNPADEGAELPACGKQLRSPSFTPRPADVNWIIHKYCEGCLAKNTIFSILLRRPLRNSDSHQIETSAPRHRLERHEQHDC